MNIKDTEAWQKWQDNNTDPYGGACVRVAKKVMELIDQQPKDSEIDANELIHKANDEGITGFMAGAVASMVSQCHARGDEFNKSWNKYWGNKDAKGTVNPAVMEIET